MSNHDSSDNEVLEVERRLEPRPPTPPLKRNPPLPKLTANEDQHDVEQQSPTPQAENVGEKKKVRVRFNEDEIKKGTKDGRRWRRAQRIQRHWQKRRKKFLSLPLHKRVLAAVKSMGMCMPYFLDDVTREDDETGIKTLKSLAVVQLCFSIMLWGLTALEAADMWDNAGSKTFDPLIVTLGLGIVAAIYVQVRDWAEVGPPSRATRSLFLASQLAPTVNYAVALSIARLCPANDPFGYTSGCSGTGREASDMADCALFGIAACAWALLACTGYVAISRVRRIGRGEGGNLTRLERVQRAASARMRRFSV